MQEKAIFTERLRLGDPAAQAEDGDEIGEGRASSSRRWRMISIRRARDVLARLARYAQGIQQ
jgi:hypothetical protein